MSGLQAEIEPLQRMFEKFISKMLAFKKDYCAELVAVPEYSGIISLCKLYSALATPENGVRLAARSVGAGRAAALRRQPERSRVSETLFEPGCECSRDPEGRSHGPCRHMSTRGGMPDSGLQLLTAHSKASLSFPTIVWDPRVVRLVPHFSILKKNIY